MRAILLLLIVGIVALILAFATGFLHLNQTQEARVPSVAASSRGVVAKGGQAPTFEVETGSVAVGTQQKQVNVELPVPALKVNRPVDNATQPPANSQ